MTPTLTPSRHAIVDELTRRSFLAVLGAAGVLTACGGREQDGRVSAADTITAKTPYGEFEVPLEPKRLVILEGRQDLEIAVALGLPKPVGLGSNAVGDDGSLSTFVPWTKEGITIIEGGETPLEKVLALEPDLIIGRDSNAEAVKDVAGVPVLPVDREGVDWKTALTDAGHWTGREQDAAEALAGYEQDAAEALAGYEEAVNEFKMKHADQLGTAVAAFLQPGLDGKWYTSNSDGFYLQARTLRDLGAQYLPFLEDTKQDASAYGPPGAMLEFSDELLSKLHPADVVVVVAGTDEERAHLESNPLWQRLPAVRAGRVSYTDWRTNSGSVYSAHECLRLWDSAYSKLA